MKFVHQVHIENAVLEHILETVWEMGRKNEPVAEVSAVCDDGGNVVAIVFNSEARQPFQQIL